VKKVLFSTERDINIVAMCHGAIKLIAVAGKLLSTTHTLKL